MTSTASSALARTEKMRAGRQADSARRRQRVITAIHQAAAAGTDISAAGIARAANRELMTRINHNPRTRRHADVSTCTTPVAQASIINNSL